MKALRLTDARLQTIGRLDDAGPAGLPLVDLDDPALLEEYGLAETFTDPARIFSHRVRLTAHGTHCARTLLDNQRSITMTLTKTFPHLYTQEDVNTVYVHDLAADTIAKMHQQLNLIRDTFGEHEEYTKAAASLAYVLSRLFRNGWDRESYVTKETDDIGLSLFVQAGPTFVFGIVWFRNRRDDGTAFEGIAGEWSCHS